MITVRQLINARISAVCYAALAACALAFAFAWAPLLRAQPILGLGAPSDSLEIVGRLTGDDVAVTGAVSMDVENGRSAMMLASGSDVTVRSGQAKIDLVEGGDIATPHIDRVLGGQTANCGDDALGQGLRGHRNSPGF
jgi:hypothetical protein